MVVEIIPRITVIMVVVEVAMMWLRWYNSYANIDYDDDCDGVGGGGKYSVVDDDEDIDRGDDIIDKNNNDGKVSDT